MGEDAERLLARRAAVDDDDGCELQLVRDEDAAHPLVDASRQDEDAAPITIADDAAACKTLRNLPPTPRTPCSAASHAHGMASLPPSPMCSRPQRELSTAT